VPAAAGWQRLQVPRHEGTVRRRASNDIRLRPQNLRIIPARSTDQCATQRRGSGHGYGYGYGYGYSHGHGHGCSCGCGHGHGHGHGYGYGYAKHLQRSARPS
jgi:hypothetical protein